jgi:hypothetical protein
MNALDYPNAVRAEPVEALFFFSAIAIERKSSPSTGSGLTDFGREFSD